MSTAAIPVHVALVDQTGHIPAPVLAQVAGALNEQVQADFAPIWGVKATVGAYPKPPAGTWAILLAGKLAEPGALGYHTDEHNQPLAYVDITGGSGKGVAADWPVTASHELLEMLADPFGNRLHAATHLPGRDHDGRVRYLLEVGDPCEATSYEVGGVPVSDFVLPAFYRSTAKAGSAFSHAGGVTEPLEVAEGGYISFVDGRGMWWQRFVQDGQAQDTQLGQFEKGRFGSLREFTDHAAREQRAR